VEGLCSVGRIDQKQACAQAVVGSLVSRGLVNPNQWTPAATPSAPKIEPTPPPPKPASAPTPAPVEAPEQVPAQVLAKSRPSAPPKIGPLKVTPSTQPKPKPKPVTSVPAKPVTVVSPKPKPKPVTVASPKPGMPSKPQPKVVPERPVSSKPSSAVPTLQPAPTRQAPKSPASTTGQKPTSSNVPTPQQDAFGRFKEAQTRYETRRKTLEAQLSTMTNAKEKQALIEKLVKARKSDRAIYETSVKSKKWDDGISRYDTLLPAAQEKLVSDDLKAGLKANEALVAAMPESPQKVQAAKELARMKLRVEGFEQYTDSVGRLEKRLDQWMAYATAHKDDPNTFAVLLRAQESIEKRKQIEETLKKNKNYSWAAVNLDQVLKDTPPAAVSSPPAVAPVSEPPLAPGIPEAPEAPEAPPAPSITPTPTVAPARKSTPKPTPTTGQGALLADIRKGAVLKKVSKSESKPQEPVKPTKGLEGALNSASQNSALQAAVAAAKARRKAINGDDGDDDAGGDGSATFLTHARPSGRSHRHHRHHKSEGRLDRHRHKGSYDSVAVYVNSQRDDAARDEIFRNAIRRGGAPSAHTLDSAISWYCFSPMSLLN